MQAVDLRRLPRSPLSSPSSRAPTRFSAWSSPGISRRAVSIWLNSGCPRPRSPTASATASQSCRRSTRTASTGRLCRRKRITDALGVQDAQTESKPDDEGDDDTGQASW